LPLRHALTTQRLRLDPTTVQDAGELFPLLNDERIWQYFPALRPHDTAHLREIYARRERGAPDDSNQVWENWIVRTRDAGVALGEAQATIFEARRQAYVAYVIASAQQRRGYAKEALAAVISHARDVHGIVTVYAELDTRNMPSYKLVESLGFRRVEERPAMDRGFGIRSAEYLYKLRV